MRKHPSSARRSIQQQSFSPYLSSKRLRNVQSLLSDDHEDAILAVLGIDSRYNEGCRELANFLLFNFYDLRLNELEESGIPEEELDDLILLIRASSVAVYCSSTLYHYLLPYIAHWHNLDIYCLQSSTEAVCDESKDDEGEEFKIHSFVAMVKDSANIGIPYWAPRHLSKTDVNLTTFDPFVVEKWPLIQSYALDGLGGNGFFTMCHQVSNIRDRLLSLYDACDPASLEQFLIKSLPLFERHWREAVNVVSGSPGDGQSSSFIAVPNVTEADVVEPVRSYFRHGRLSENQSKPVGARRRTNESLPFVQFGVRTNESTDQSCSQFAAICNSGARGNALHLIIHSKAPKSPISCTRTYFICPSENDSAAKKGDFDKLVGLYGACVKACRLATEKYCSAHDVRAAEKVARDTVAMVAEQMSHGGACEVELQAVDNTGRLLPLSSLQQSPHVRRITVSVKDIRSCDGKSLLGTVAFADTFIDSAISAVDGGPTVSGEARVAPRLQSSCLLLTSEVPEYSAWQLEPSPITVTSKPVATLENCLLCSPSPLCSVVKRTHVDFFEDGSMTFHPSNAVPFHLGAGDVRKLCLYQSGQSHDVALLKVDPEDGAVTRAPIHIRQPVGNRSFAIAIYPQSLPMKSFESKVKPMLEDLSKRAESFEFCSLDLVPSGLDRSLVETQRLYEWHLRSANFGPGKMSAKLYKAAASLQPKLSEFMAHFAVSSVLRGTSVPKSDFSFLLNGLSDMGEVSQSKSIIENKVCITVVTGLPGSHADRLSSSLVSLHKERVRWVTIRVGCVGADATRLDSEHFQTQLADAVSKRKASRPGAAASKKLRIVVESVGFFDIADIISCILHHRNPATRDAMFVGAVTACVEPLTCVLEQRRFLPKTAEQFRAGLVTCVAFTGSVSDLKDKNLAEMKSYVRAANPDAAFLLAAGGVVSRSADFDLILNEWSFNSPDCVKARHLSVPGIWNGSFVSGQPHLGLTKMQLSFAQPLLRATLSARLRALRKSLVSSPYTNNIYVVRGAVAFTDSATHDNDVTFVTTTGEMTLAARNVQQGPAKAPAPPPSKKSISSKPFNLAFYGVDLSEEALKSWLRKCGRQRASKKSYKTRAIMTRAEINAIQEQHSTDPLPEGVFFNGTQYCSLVDNSRTYEHPHLEKFIEQYLAAENRKIDAFNLKIESDNVADLFD